MPLQRQAYQDILAWKKNPQHKALLITGARQVGKTFLVRAFAREYYKTVLEINFVEQPSAKAIFEGDLDIDTLITSLTAYSNKPLKPRSTLIFFDEIQECPRARTAIKFLVDDGRFDYIESGFLLGISYKDVPSYPVGYEQVLSMYPLTLEEFYQANGVQEKVLTTVRECFQSRKSVPEAIHNRLKQLFYYYLVVGGMPAAVQNFINTNDIAQTLVTQKSILALYRQDIAKYASNKSHVHAIFDYIPAELNKKNKRFKLSDLAKSARMERYESDFMWLSDAGVALPCYNVTEPKPPLALNQQHNLFKVYLCDTGLLCAATMDSIQFDLIQGNVKINWGSILENVIAQQLVAKESKLYYFDKPKIGEIDFLLKCEGAIVPLEAKSGKDCQQHRALDKLLAVKEWNIHQAYVLCGENVCAKGSLLYLPWYMVFCLHR